MLLDCNVQPDTRSTRWIWTASTAGSQRGFCISYACPPGVGDVQEEIAPKNAFFLRYLQRLAFCLVCSNLQGGSLDPPESQRPLRLYGPVPVERILAPRRLQGLPASEIHDANSPRENIKCCQFCMSTCGGDQEPTGSACHTVPRHSLALAGQNVAQLDQLLVLTGSELPKEVWSAGPSQPNQPLKHDTHFDFGLLNIC